MPLPYVAGEMAVAEQIKIAAVASGLSLTELGRLAGVSRPSMSRFVHGRHSLRLDVLEKLARELGFTVETVPVFVGDFGEQGGAQTAKTIRRMTDDNGKPIQLGPRRHKRREITDEQA